MLHQTIIPDGGLPLAHGAGLANQRSQAMNLVAGMRRSLDVDPALARHYLERLAALLHPEPKVSAQDEALIPGGIVRRPARRKGGLAPWQENRVLDHIDTNLGGSIVAEDLAVLVGLSAGHFTRAFKATTGETPHAYLMRQRIRRAQILMLETSETLAQIACACGLADQAHLARLFRTAVGLTPTAWRRNWQRPGNQ